LEQLHKVNQKVRTKSAITPIPARYQLSENCLREIAVMELELERVAVAE
jgi:hypothetical protein